MFKFIKRRIKIILANKILKVHTDMIFDLKRLNEYIYKSKNMIFEDKIDGISKDRLLLRNMINREFDTLVTHINNQKNFINRYKDFYVNSVKHWCKYTSVLDFQSDLSEDEKEEENVFSKENNPMFIMYAYTRITNKLFETIELISRNFIDEVNAFEKERDDNIIENIYDLFFSGGMFNLKGKKNFLINKNDMYKPLYKYMELLYKIIYISLRKKENKISEEDFKRIEKEIKDEADKVTKIIKIEFERI